MSVPRERVPTPDDAARIAREFAREPVRDVSRFALGLASFVYDVSLVSGHELVVRMGRARDAAAFAGAVHWSARLRPLGVPLPELLAHGRDGELPYLVLERLPGVDLQIVYASLSAAKRRTLAARVAAIQARVGAMPEGTGFGYVVHESGPFPHTRWSSLIATSLARSRTRIAHAGLVSGDPVARVERAFERLTPILDAVRPRAFLDDTTTKNVIVDRGRLAGIVDVDVVGYGDPLFPLALTRTALLSRAWPLDYTEAWAAELDLGPERECALHLYTAVFCVDFMSEMGQRFNRDEPLPLDVETLERLRAALAAELAAL